MQILQWLELGPLSGVERERWREPPGTSGSGPSKRLMELREWYCLQVFREACGLGLIPKSPRVLQAVCTEADDAVMQNGPPPPESYRVTASLLFSTDRVGIDSFGIDGLEKASARSMHHASGVRTYKDATLMEPWPLLPLGGMQSPSVSPFERR